MGAEDIKTYLQANYCPTVEDQELCEEHLAEYYTWMLVLISNCQNPNTT